MRVWPLWLHLRRSVAGPTVVLDVDGVLVDSTFREEAARAEAGGDRQRFWDVFLSERYTHLDLAAGQALYAWARSRGYNVAVVTGRPRRLLDATLLQLAAAGIEPDAVLAREEGVYMRDDRLKLRALEVLENLGARIVLVVDDSERVVSAARAVGYNAVRVRLIAFPASPRVDSGGQRHEPSLGVLEHTPA